MNITEFAALKAGDKVVNLMAGSTGEVVEITDQGVKVCWYAGTAPRVYVANSTAWMHWDKIEAPRNDEGMNECCPAGCQHTPCRASAGSLG